MDDWEKFEHDLAERFGLQRVPGSGNKWYNKLDVQGKGTRWSLKYSDEKGINLTRSTLAEAILATGGMGGGGEIPIWAVRLGDFDDFIMMRAEDWRRFFLEDSGFSVQSDKAEQRRKLAAVPQLLREDEDE